MAMKRKTKNKNKINKKRGWQKINREKRKRALAHRIGVTKMKLLKEKKTKLMIGKNKKHHKNTRGKNGRESNLKKKKENTENTQQEKLGGLGKKNTRNT